MRPFITVVACLAASYCAAMTSAARAEEPPPDGDKILALLGADLPTVFATLGGPTSAFVSGRDDKPESEDMIFLDYRTFFLELSNDRTSVALIKFASAFEIKGDEWTGSIRGFKYGDSREKVQAALGQPYSWSGFGKTKDGADIRKGIDYFKVNDKNGRLEVHYNDSGNAYLAQAIGVF